MGDGGARRGRVVAALLRGAARRAWFVEDEVAGVLDLVPPGGTCVDVGAEFGLYTVAMALAVGEGGMVHAVEPQPGAHRVMDRVADVVAGDGRVVRHRVALGATPDRGTLSVPLRRGLAVHGRAFLTTGARHGGPNDDEFARERRLTVEVTTLDLLCELHDVRRLDLLKADVEGAELQVLRGGVAALERHRPIVQLEIEQPHLDRYGATVADVTGFLTGRGYTMHLWDDGAWRRSDRVVPTHRNYLFRP